LISFAPDNSLTAPILYVSDIASLLFQRRA
jgi:hypothetical protein